MSRATSARMFPIPVTMANRPIEQASIRASNVFWLVSSAIKRRSMSSAIAFSLSLGFATPTKGESDGTVKETAGSPTFCGAAPR